MSKIPILVFTSARLPQLQAQTVHQLSKPPPRPSKPGRTAILNNDRRDILLRAAELVALDKYRVKIVESTQQETAAAPYWANFNWAGEGGGEKLSSYARGDCQ